MEPPMSSLVADIFPFYFEHFLSNITQTIIQSYLETDKLKTY